MYYSDPHFAFVLISQKKFPMNFECFRFRCSEPKTLRVSVNTFLDLLSLVVQTIHGFDPSKFADL